MKSIIPPPTNLVSTFESNTEALVVVLQEKERIREADLAEKERGLLAFIRVADLVQRFAAPIIGTVEGIVKQLFFSQRRSLLKGGGDSVKLNNDYVTTS